MKLSAELLPPLLDLYPIGLIKERWKIKSASKESLITDVIEKATSTAITSFCRETHGNTRQHVYVFDGGWEEFPDVPEPLLPYSEIRTSGPGKNVEIFVLPTVTFTVISSTGTGAKRTELKFPWPITIRVEKKITVASFTILAKNLKAYLPETALVTSKRDLDEPDINQALSAALRKGKGFVPVDLNKGIKALWEADRIDALATSWKSPQSTLTETMDQKLLMKRDRPGDYNDAMKAPLYKTLFKYIGKEVGYPDQFSADPTRGLLMFNRFGRTPGEVENVLREILRLG